MRKGDEMLAGLHRRGSPPLQRKLVRALSRPPVRSLTLDREAPWHQREGAASPIVAALAAVLATFLASTLVGAPPAEAANRQPALKVLSSLPVSSEVDSGYSRELFRHWIDAGGDGCDTREEVLIAERISGSVVGCRVVGGRWRSLYDGAVTSNSSSFDVDHMVPLKEAWDSGAWRWSAVTREDFANDLGYAHSLIAVSASSNRSKSDRDPTEWLPALGRCAYAKYWIGVKYRWRLSVNPAEKSTLARVLAGCPPLMVLPALATRTENPNAQTPGSTGSGGGLASGGDSGGQLDPRFDTCGEANAAGYGPYSRGQDPEYRWYIDRDSDGVACER